MISLDEMHSVAVVWCVRCCRCWNVFEGLQFLLSVHQSKMASKKCFWCSGPKKIQFLFIHWRIEEYTISTHLFYRTLNTNSNWEDKNKNAAKNCMDSHKCQKQFSKRRNLSVQFNTQRRCLLFGVDEKSANSENIVINNKMRIYDTKSMRPSSIVNKIWSYFFLLSRASLVSLLHFFLSQTVARFGSRTDFYSRFT